MAEKENEPGKLSLSRRDFLKVSAAGAAAAGALEMSFGAQKALAYPAGYTTSTTTCPYCSASCGQRVVVDPDGVTVLDLYGDEDAPWNRGGLCAKGAGGFQLATNPRRLGYPNAGAHPVNSNFNYDANFADGVAYRRQGNASWEKVALNTALGDIAQKLIDARDANGAAPSLANGHNSKQVAFFGCSHMNNEQNNSYRKLVATFGTTNVEHQARI